MNDLGLCSRCLQTSGTREVKTVQAFPAIVSLRVENVEVWTCRWCGTELPVGSALHDARTELVLALLHKAASLTGAEVRLLRAYTQLKQAELAATMGVDKATISRWENDALPIGQQSDRFLRTLVALKLGRPDVLDRLPHTAVSPPTPLVMSVRVGARRIKRTA